MSRRHHHDDRPASWLSILTVAAVPAVALASLWQGADAYVPPPTTTTTTTTVPPAPKPELDTPLLSVRRHPAPMAAQHAAEEATSQMASSVSAVTSRLGADTCLQIVDPDGIPANPESIVVAEHQPELSVVPASNEKLFVAAAALEVLGPDYRFETRVVGAPPVDGVVDGDLYLVGGGDPLLVTDPNRTQQRYPAFNTTPLTELADAVVAAGVTTINGQLVGDGSRYDDEWRAPSWGANISLLDVAPTDGLLVDDGFLFDSGVAPNPNLAAAETFAALLRERGVTVAAGATAGTAPSDAGATMTTIAAIESEPLTEVLVELLHTSDNTTAEMLVKELGLIGAGEGNRTKGLGVIASTLSSWGLPIATLSLQDGSGLSSGNRTSCDTLVSLFERAPVADDLIELLPVAGRDGTLQDQLLGTAAEGVLRAKTGTLTGVKALTGVQRDANGDPVVFALVLNEPTSNDPAIYQPLWADVVGLIDLYPVDVVIDESPFVPR